MGSGWGQSNSTTPVLLDNYDGTGDLVYAENTNAQWAITGGIYVAGTDAATGPEHSCASYDLTSSISTWSVAKANQNVWIGYFKILRTTSGWGTSNYGCGAVLASNLADFSSTSAQGYALVIENGTTDKVTLVKFSQGIKDGSTNLPANSTAIVSVAVDPGTTGFNYMVELLSDGKWKISYITGAQLSDANAVVKTSYSGGTATSTAADETYTGVNYKYTGWVFAHSNGNQTSDKANFDNLGAAQAAAGLTPPTLTAAAGATVDAPFNVTFTDDATWRAAITSIKVEGTTLTAGSSVSSGQITFTPSASSPAALLQTAGTKTITVVATGYTDATVSQTIGVGAANKLGITTQPTAPSTNGGVLATQPVVAIQDQYGNTTTSTATVNAAVGAGTWTLGGTTSVAGVNGAVTYAGLTATSSGPVTGATISFNSGSLTGTTSNTFNIPAPPPPTLTAAAGATVDAPFTVTFTDNATWRAAITSITVGGTTLTAGYSVSAGQITFTPSASVPASLLQTSGTKTIAVIATGYSNATVSQTINPGVATKLGVTQQPTAPAANGGVLAQQPKIAIQDQYGNTVAGSTATVVAAVGAGTWTLGGTTSVAAVSGIVTYSGLTATSASAVTGATIGFTSGSLTATTSNTFNIPAPAPVNDLCSGALAITCGNSLTVDNTSATDDVLPGVSCGINSVGYFKGIWFTVTPAASGDVTVSACGSSATLDTYLRIYGGTCGSFTTCVGFNDDGCGSTYGPSKYTFPATANTTYYILLGMYDASSTPGSVIINATCPLVAPVATAANPIGSNSFTANWNASAGATGGYKLDVSSTAFSFASTTETFTAIGGGTTTSYLTRTWTGVDGITWTSYKTRTDQTIFSGNDAITLQDATGAYLVSGEITGSPSNIAFDIQQKFSGSGGSVIVKILSGTGYTTITTIGTYGFTTTASVINASVSGIIGPFKVQIENDAVTRPCIDNLAITRDSFTPVGVFDNYAVAGTSQVVGSLSSNTTYYYRVRATDGSNVSGNSNTITVNTLPPSPTITSFTPTSGCSSGGTSVTITGTNFTGATAVTFNGSNAASFTVDNATQITAVTPSGVTTGQISVTTPGGTVQSAGDFTVTQSVTPSVTIVASANPVTSGTSVAITATPVNGGTTPLYQFYVNGDAFGTQTSNPSFSFAPPAGSYDIYVVMTPDPTLPCFSPATATSDHINLVVTASPATSTWTGGGNDHNWHNAANWDNGVPGLTTAVTIPSGLGNNYPTVSSPAICGSITIESGASLINNGLLGIPAGQATVKRVISDAADDKWHLFISPITQSIAATGTSCFNGAYLDRYDEPSGEWVRLVTGENVVPGYGYSINYLAGSRDLEFTGTLKNSPLSYSNLSYTSGASGYGPGWNLIGNPYPCGINPSLCAAPSGMNAYAYIWNTGSGNYDPLQFGSDETIIAPLQGFFVRTTSGTNSLSLANIAKTHGGTFYKNDNVEPEALMVRINGNNYSDQTKVRFNSDATAGFDQSYDAYKLWGLDEAPQLYSILSDEVAAVNTLPSIGSNPLVPLGLKVGAESSYTLTFEGMESFDSQIPLRLDDLKLGISKDIRTDPVYSFTAAPGDAENRFRLRFASAIGFEDPEASNILISSERNVIRVNYMGSAAGTIHLYNDAGQLLSTQALSRGETTMSAAATGIYLVKVITGKSVVTKKVVVVR